MQCNCNKCGNELMLKTPGRDKQVYTCRNPACGNFKREVIVILTNKGGK